MICNLLPALLRNDNCYTEIRLCGSHLEFSIQTIFLLIRFQGKGIIYCMYVCLYFRHIDEHLRIQT